MQQSLKVGVIQTTVDNLTAWNKNGKLQTQMSIPSQNAVIDELRKGFKDLKDRRERPKIVLIPEYSIPNSAIHDIKSYAIALNTVVIGGLDLQSDKGGKVKNQGAIFIPNNWNSASRSSFCNVIKFGKNFYAEEELEWFNECKKTHISDPVTYIIDAGDYGNIGIAICADFYDINRFTIYKGRIHHLFIIAYNRDFKSFEFLTEAISRLLLCNVVICNAGKYGNSLAFSPYRKDWQRMIFKGAGANLFVSQVLELPVRELDENQSKAHEKYQNSGKSPSYKNDFKWPPGYKKYNLK